jgi:hypothetical protein
MNQFQYQVIFLGVILLFIIFFSLSNVEPVPYNKSSVFSNVYPYSEGMGGGMNPAPTTAVVTTAKPTSTPTPTPKKMEGFEGLHSSPYGTEKPIDIFSQLESRKDCEPSPFSNSLGYLCLDKNARQMLLTRGGNQTGGESQIGSPYTQ